MAMEISGSYRRSLLSYAEQMEEKWAAGRAKKEKGENEKPDDAKASDRASEPHDEYISSEKSGARPNGLYRVGQDENGNRKIFFDNPNKPDCADGKGQLGANGDSGQPKVNGDNPEKPAEERTVNTDKVDREIRKLKEKKQKLEQQIQSASGDQKKVQELEKKLAQVENELKQKDNDTYRRQHAEVSE